MKYVKNPNLKIRKDNVGYICYNRERVLVLNQEAYDILFLYDTPKELFFAENLEFVKLLLKHGFLVPI